MRSQVFPNPAKFDFPKEIILGNFLVRTSDIIAVGIPPTVDNLRESYRKGIFPWPAEGLPLPWHCPVKRAILEFESLHIPRSLKRARRAAPFSFTIDHDFPAVIENCSRVKRPEQIGTWITPRLIEAFRALHSAGIAHSVEAWDEAGTLVGGLYGVDAGGVFCGESMFFKQPNASKLALLFLIDHLKERGAKWLDAQVMTPHMEALGAIEIERREFLGRLDETQLLGLNLFDKDSL